MYPTTALPIPEGCRLTKSIRDARFRISHVTRDLLGNYSERFGWLSTDIVCDDKSRVVIQYDGKDFLIDVPAREIAIIGCQEIAPAVPDSGVPA